jgi:hypothetical protein
LIYKLVSILGRLLAALRLALMIIDVVVVLESPLLPVVPSGQYLMPALGKTIGGRYHRHIPDRRHFIE